MTRNIVAEFSSSFVNGTEETYFKKYPVISGSVFNEEYSEILDSATILLSHVSETDRLTKIKPYDFCRVYDRTSEYNSETGRYAFDHVYLVDNYNEKEDNISENHRLFSYTINLMSQTKLLEKVQCPNLSITHDVKDGVINKKTIFEKICEYMELFTPKAKMYNSSTDKWEYRPLIEIPGVKVSESETKSGRRDETISSEILPGDESDEFSIEVEELVGKTISNYILNAVNAYDLNGNSIPAHTTGKRFDSSTGKFFYKVKNESSEGDIHNIITNVDIRLEYSYIVAENIYHYNYKVGYEDFYNKFNVPCADLGSSQYTLRALLTMLMQQVGCIPSVQDLRLGYLDFNADNGQFDLNGDYTVGNTVNYINKSLSSDSFANTLINMSNNVLDSENKVISEKIGFRDSSNVLLKQKENLVLETKFPIYKINKLSLNCFSADGLGSGSLSGSKTVITLTGPVTGYITWGVKNVSGRKITVFSKSSATQGIGINIGTMWINATIYTYNYDSQSGYTLVESKNIATEDSFSSFDTEEEHEITMSHDFDYYLIMGTATSSWKVMDLVHGYVSVVVNSSGIITDAESVSYLPVDITPIVKESSERSLLSTNFKEMEDKGTPKTIEELTKYVYGTVEYSIGGNKITGFSNYYEQLDGSVFVYTYGKTYIENIYNWLNENYIGNQIADRLENTFHITIPEGIRSSIKAGEFNPAGKNMINFSSFTFDIEYQPLNSFNMSFVKKDDPIDFSLEQLNSSDSGLSDFDRLSLNQQETVDRIGNDTIFISQRINPDQFASNYLRGGEPFNFKPVYYNRDGQRYTIFKRTYTVGNYKYDVSYSGSRNAILKDYFVSIRTKYRAYQYVDYNQSVLRKEKDVIYVRIGEDYYNGDDKIYFSNGISALISGFQNNNNVNGLKYECEESQNDIGELEKTKNELSVISSDYGFAMIYEQSETNSAGPYIANLDYSTYGYTTGEEGGGTEKTNYKLGGVPQKWQMWYQNKYGNNHKVFYTSDLNYYNYGDSFVTQDDAFEMANAAAVSPIITNIGIPSTANVMYVCDDNINIQNLTRTFYKDISERLNHTVQFIYYPASENINWTENFIANNLLINNSDFVPNKIYYSDSVGSLSLNKNLHDVEDDFVEYEGPISDFVSIPYPLNDRMSVNWNGHRRIKVCYKDSSGKIADFIIFKRGGASVSTPFYVSLNDTKSDYVLDKMNGMLFRQYKVATNTNNRGVIINND